MQFVERASAYLHALKRAHRRWRLERSFTAVEVSQIQRRVERGDYHRASGDMQCAVCGYEYRWHSGAPVTSRDGDLYLKILCDDSLVKL